MPAPTNISAATATDLGNITSTATTVTQDVHFSGTTYTVWYTFTAPAGVEMVNIFARGDFNNPYDPYIIVRTGPDAGSLSSHLGIENDEAPVQIPVEAGEQYWLEITFSEPGHPTPAVLTLTTRAFVQAAAPAGSILIPDDANGFPGAIVSPSTGAVLRFVSGFPAGESAYVLDDGYILAEDETAGVKLLTPDLATVDTINWNPTGVHAGFITGRGEHFYIGNPSSASNGDMPANSVRLVNKDGTLGTTWTPTGYTAAGVGADGGALAVSPDETILYWHTSTGTHTLKAWDLINDVALPDLATGPVGMSQKRQILALNDGTILATYVSSPNVTVRRYDTDGTVLNTYAFTSVLADIGDNQIALAPDDPTSFYVFLKPVQGYSQFKRIRTSDGTVLATSPQAAQYELGAYRPTKSADPAAWWGHSESCPFLVLRGVIEPVLDPSVPTLCCDNCGCHGCCGSGPTLAAGHSGPLGAPVENSWSSLAPDTTEGRLLPSTPDPTYPETWS